jgi:hypothetical protein
VGELLSSIKHLKFVIIKVNLNSPLTIPTIW